MQATKSARRNFSKRNVWAAVLMVALGAACVYEWPAEISAAEASLLGGRITSATGGALAGVPVRAHRENSNMTVSVYTNSRGEYTYPDWVDLSPGSYSVAIELAEFEPARREAVALSAGKAARVDFTLQPRQPSVLDATASDIVAALPGSDDQKHLLIQCDNCHSLQFAFRTPRSKEGWMQIIRRMAGERAVSRETPGTRAFGQKKYVEPLAEYLASVRGPGSSDDIPFHLRPRPTAEASTRLVVTEYDLPRGGSREVNIIRGDKRAAWPHDVLVDPKGPYVWYTDHFAFFLGRLDRRTGAIKEFPYTLLPGMGRAEMGVVVQAQERAGNPGGGAHDMAFDPEGNIIFGMGGGTLRFNPKTEEFTRWASGSNMFGLDPAGNVWYLDDGLHKLDPKTGEVKSFTVPDGTDDDTYDMEVDSQGRSIMNLFRQGKIGVFDPQTDKFVAYPTPTPGSGPRRGEIDAQGRAWMGLYWAGRVGMFDPSKREIREYPLISGSKPYTAPFPSPYTVAVDDKNQLVWTNDFNSSRIYRIEMKTGQATEFFMPAPYEVRDLTVDRSATRPTVWIPAYRPPSRIVKVQAW
jgi:virginiamycin B lyase